MGTPVAAVPSLERIVGDGHEVVAVYTQPDRPAGRGNRVTAPPVKEFAASRGIPVFQPTKIRIQESIETFRSHDADVAVVVAYGRILPASYLEAFRYGAVNVHFSLLPKYRGAAPVNWAIVNGETETGVTTMKMDEGLDTGEILLQRRTAIGEAENAVELMARLATDGAGLLSETLAQIETIVPVAQDDSEATLAPIMKKEDGRIDWSMTATSVVNRIRGFQPFPTSYSFVDGRKLTFWQAAAETTTASAEPGSVLTAKGDDLSVACAPGTAVRVTELQIEGKRRMPVRDFLNGVKIAVGTVIE